MKKTNTASDQIIAIITLLLVLCYWLLSGLNLQWDWLASRQQDTQFKRLSGLLLCLYLGTMWLLFFFREARRPDKTAQYLNFHKVMGLLSPIAFYLHASKPGLGYQMLLSLVFFANLLVGILYKVIRQLGKRYYRIWIAIHLFLAAVLPILILFHIYISFAFK